MRRPRVLLADDHVMVAQGLGRLIEESADLVGTVSDGEQLVEQALRLHPDVIVTDVSMPVMGGLEAMRRLKTAGVGAKFVFLTIHSDAGLATQALREGAAGYLLKDAAVDELVDAIRAVADGRTYLTPLITKDVIHSLAQPSSHEPLRLTPRQQDVLRLIAEGKRMKEIATALDISVRTVEGHKYELMHVLGLENTADLIRFAIKQGVVSG